MPLISYYLLPVLELAVTVAMPFILTLKSLSIVSLSIPTITHNVNISEKQTTILRFWLNYWLILYFLEFCGVNFHIKSLFALYYAGQSRVVLSTLEWFYQYKIVPFTAKTLLQLLNLEITCEEADEILGNCVDRICFDSGLVFKVFSIFSKPNVNVNSDSTQSSISSLNVKSLFRPFLENRSICPVAAPMMNANEADSVRHQADSLIPLEVTTRPPESRPSDASTYPAEPSRRRRKNVVLTSIGTLDHVGVTRSLSPIASRNLSKSRNVSVESSKSDQSNSEIIGSRTASTGSESRLSFYPDVDQSDDIPHILNKHNHRSYNNTIKLERQKSSPRRRITSDSIEKDVKALYDI